MKITKRFLNYCWSITEGKSNDVSIQQLRLFIFLFQNLDTNTYGYDSTLSEVYSKVYKYKNNNKQLQLMNWKEYKKIINSYLICKINPDTNEIHFNLKHDLFLINGTKKQEYDKKRSKQYKKDPYHIMAEYEEFAYINVKDEIWDSIRATKTFLTHKLFIYILSEKVRGPFKFIQTNINDLKKMLNLNEKDNRQVKIRVTKSLTLLKEVGLITNFKYDSFNKYHLTIQK